MPIDDLATLVDERDNVIGSKPRRDITYADIYRVSALWLTNSRDEVLIAQRSFNKRNNPGKWGPAAAGTVEPGETYEQNIYHEAEEEIGLTGITFQTGSRDLVDEANIRRHFTQWFTATLDQPLEKFTLQAEEVEQIAWIPAAQLRADIQTHPAKYILSAPGWIGMFL